MNKNQLIAKAKVVLKKNDLGGWTQPAPGLYPHQWLWDSAFIAIGLRHYNLKRAKSEVLSVFRAQWKNGMLPHVIFTENKNYHAGPKLWQTHRSQVASDQPSTGISQPPVIAEAVVRIGEKLNKKDRLVWYKRVYPGLAAYHKWLYTERDPDKTGRVLVFHSWESGLDNTPPWMEALKGRVISKRAELAKYLHVVRFFERLRKDTSIVPAEQRMSTVDLLNIYGLIRRQRAMRYDYRQILKKQKVLVEDLTFNCILIRNNQHLAQIAAAIDKPLPKVVEDAIKKQHRVLESFWSEPDQQYFSRDYRKQDFIKTPTFATFMPLYATKLKSNRLRALLNLMSDSNKFNTPFGIPSTPLDSPYFKPHCYWQGPVWVNTQWMIIDGLRRSGMERVARVERKKIIDLVKKCGFNEYFSPLDGTPAGAFDFSWTAALMIDLLNDKTALRKK